MNNNHGYTLVEVIASITILVLLGTVFFQFFISSQKNTVSNKEKLVSVNHAQLVLEEIKASDWDNPVKTGDYSDIITGSHVDPYDYDYCLNLDSKEKCTKLFKKEIEGRTYDVIIFVYEVNEVDLYPVQVEIHCNGNQTVRSSVKGLVDL